MNQKGFSPIVILLIVIILSGLVGYAYYLGAKKQESNQTHKQNPVTQTPQAIPAIIPSSPANSVSNKTNVTTQYSNPNLKFTFTIPNGYKFEKEDASKATFSGTYGEDQIIPSELVLNFKKTIELNKLKNCSEVIWQDNVDTMCIDGEVENKTYNGIDMKLFNLKTGSKNSMAKSDFIVHMDNPNIEFTHSVIGGGVQSRMDELLSTFKIIN